MGHSHEHQHEHHHCSHDHSHGHSHGHSESNETNDSHDAHAEHNHRSIKSSAITEKERRHQVLKKLKTASLLCLTFLIVEVIGGILAGSLAVLSDAAHLAADLSAFVVAIVGSHIASLPASDAHTFGLKRTESLAALFSMVSLVILSIGLAVEAVRRLWVIGMVPGGDIPVDGKLMATIAFIGVVVNVILAFVLGEDHVHMVGSEDCSGGHDHSHSHVHGNGCSSSHNSHSHDHGHDNAHSYDEGKSWVSV